jgi:hypothetical protein
MRWPVCARCTGVYVSAALVGLSLVSLPRVGVPPLESRRWRTLLACAAVPVAGSWLLERIGVLETSNIVRAALSVPLGAALAAALTVVRRTSAPANLR